jgi:hypothetical protein
MKSPKIYLIVISIFIYGNLYSQTTYNYPLSEDFSALQSGAPDLIQIANNSGASGEFVNREVPITTCGEEGIAQGYFFEDDAGLQFNNPVGFINTAYSLAFNFQIDEFITPPSWVRILSFTHVDDIGIYILLTNPPNSGTLEFWPYGTVGESDFFTTEDFYQLILVRNTDGLVKIYINGSEFAEYDDSETRKFVPTDPDHFIVFFRDHPSVLANEASPGFVSDITIANNAWSDDEVQGYWEDFCNFLLSTEEESAHQLQVFPNPATDKIYISQEYVNGNPEIQIHDIFGRVISIQTLRNGSESIDISNIKKGMYLIRIIQDNKVDIVKFEKE